ncbi:hypothetical protein PF003_g36224 [Phytophthora fragariae]|nr:hypothetical protein PF003_g36224 [Phytophthora fragariae]
MWICCLVYLDDVIIFTKGTVAQHVVELAVVLERLSEADLSLKASKCSFATTSMEYLGHDLTPDGIQPTSRLVKASVDFPRPQDDMQVRRFVALAGYYRRFVPDFGARMAPLTTLLRKTSEWTWGEAQEEAFTWAKAWLSTKPVLVYPDYDLPFKLTTDASKAGHGAVLSQDQGRGDQPVAYASMVNSPTVANYSISELECLAVVWAVRLFCPHLYGRRFTIVTDHVALKWLMTTKEPAGRLHRWALTLQEYDFDIVYRPGKENHVADALSRGPAAMAATMGENKANEADDDPAIGPGPKLMSGSSTSDAKCVETLEPAAEKTSVARTGLTKRELTLLAVHEDVEAAACPAVAQVLSAKAVSDAYLSPTPYAELATSPTEAEVNHAAVAVIEAGVVRRVDAAELGVVQFTDADIEREQGQSVMVQALFKKGKYQGQRVFVKDDGLVNIQVGGGEAGVILPAVYWPLAFKEAHDSIWAGHLRGPQTYERLRRLYWWPYMQNTVRDWVSACQDCGSRKARPQAVIPPLRSVRTGEVGDRWAIDVAGPLPVTMNGNRYVIAAVEYTTRYAVAASVPEHTAKSIARFLMDRVVLVYGPMREIMMDGAREFTS